MKKRAGKTEVTELQNEQTSKKVRKSKKRKKSTIIISIIIILVLIAGAMSCTTGGSTTALVSTTNATRGELQESISTSGTISSEQQKVIFAEVSGRLETVNVAAGDAVKAGDVLISFDMKAAEDVLTQAKLQQSKSTAGYEAAMSNNNDSQAKLREAKTNLKVLEQQIADWKANLKNLQKELSDYQRELNNSLAEENFELSEESEELQEELAALDKNAADYAVKAAEIQEELADIREEMAYNQYKQQIAGSSDYVAELQEEIAKVQEELADFEAYKAEMEGQKTSGENTVLDSYDKQQYEADKQLSAMSYQTAKEAYDKAKQGVVAEFDGIIMECSAVQGSNVTEGMQLLTIANSQAVKITFQASKHDVEKLKTGQQADITISGNSYQGNVSKINRMATMNASNTPMVGVEVHITNPDDNIILGLDAKLEIFTGKTEDALLIPVESVNADKEGDFLYVVENGIVVRKPIVCGISSDTYTEVLEGITEEDEIIVSSLTDFEEGMAVTVMPAQ